MVCPARTCDRELNQSYGALRRDPSRLKRIVGKVIVSTCRRRVDSDHLMAEGTPIRIRESDPGSLDGQPGDHALIDGARNADGPVAPLVQDLWALHDEDA